jgi:hypothetical protein
MFSIERVEKGEPCRIEVTGPEGRIEISGDTGFVTQVFESICGAGPVVLEFVRRALEDATKEDIAVEMRRAGFPESIVTDFENN